MTQIKRLYASSGPEVIIETLQITVGSDIHYLCGATKHHGNDGERRYRNVFSLCDRHCAAGAQCGRHAGPQICPVQYRWCCVHGDPLCAG